jgi:hypothetical protein
MKIKLISDSLLSLDNLPAFHRVRDISHQELAK